MKIYFDSLKRLYISNKINADQLQIAVTKGWITIEEVNEILNN